LRLIGGLPSGTAVAFEAAYGWGWLVELLDDFGFDPHLVHPLRCKAIASARLKNDKVDAAILARLLRADLLPEAWIAPLPVRQLRALLRHRASLVRLGTQLRNRIHAVAATSESRVNWTGSAAGHLPSTWKVTVNHVLAPAGRTLPGVSAAAGSWPQVPQACEVAFRPLSGRTGLTRRSVTAAADWFVTCTPSCSA
jgi:transposase